MPSKPIHNYIVLALVVLLSLLFQATHWNEFPQYIHSWAQCDRYALALGFLDNGGDFLRPQTFVMNNQFPGEFMIPRETTVTSVDFPIHDYLVSGIMRLAHSTEPWCFRMYVCLYAMVGLYALYRLGLLLTRNVLRAATVVLFAMSSPVFLYYQAGFLPTIPSLANAIIALYAYVLFFETGRRRFFYLALSFMTLAALARLPFGILLVAMICYEGWQAFRNKRFELYRVLGFLMAIALIVGYYRYNGILRERYGSLFLNYIIPATSWHDLVDFTRTAWKRWIFDYFDASAWTMFMVVALGGGFFAIRHRAKVPAVSKKFFLLLLITFGGCCLYYLLMCYQFMNHDYYFLDTFYLPVVGFFLFFMACLPPVTLRASWGLVPLLSFIPLFVQASNRLQARMALFENAEHTTAVAYREAHHLLDSLGIAPQARMLVLGSDGSNNAFILLRRKGFVIIEPEREKIEAAMAWPWDYVVVDEGIMMTTVYRQYPAIVNTLRKVGGNGRIAVYRRSLHGEGSSGVTQFFELDQRPFRYHEEAVGDSARNEFLMLPEEEYGYTFHIRQVQPRREAQQLLKVNCYTECTQPLNDLLVCVSLNLNGQTQWFDAVDLGADPAGPLRARHTALFRLPALHGGSPELNVFLWNRGKNNLRYGEFQVTIY